VPGHLVRIVAAAACEGRHTPIEAHVATVDKSANEKRTAVYRPCTTDLQLPIVKA
jgi:hypothetical protein